MRVLIADDKEMALTLLRTTLVESGYEVDAARNGREALELLRSRQHRLVICDWEMPQMTGVELCRAVRSEDTLGYVYMMLLTARDSYEQKVEGLSAGADDFITKPYHPAELIARVRNAERILSIETRDVAIFAMAKLAESRDPETGAHLERVRGYSRLLAQQMSRMPAYRQEITSEYIRLIYLTSPLHDIGKVGIPDSVLLKPGRLCDREFAIMKEHTVIGARTLESALERFPEVGFLRMARDIAATHHERWDGTGYPRGLKGTQIPTAGRIVALADVYDAMTSKRVYKGAFSHEIARSLILEEKGAHFDPDVVEAFLKVESEFIAIRSRLNEEAAAEATAAAAADEAA